MRTGIYPYSMRFFFTLNTAPSYLRVYNAADPVHRGLATMEILSATMLWVALLVGLW